METALTTYQGALTARNAEKIESFLEENLAALEEPKDSSTRQLVTVLFSVYQSSRAEDLNRDISELIVPKIVASPGFFVKVFEQLGKDDQADSELLKLIYEALFSVINSESPLVKDYCQIVLPKIGQMCPENQAFAILVATQFLIENTYLFDFKLDGSLYSLPLLAYGISLIGTEPLKAREHISTALEADAVQQIVDIVAQLEQDIQYAHTLATVLHPLLLMTQMSKTLANAVAAVLEPFPLAAQKFWDAEALEVLNLTRSKLPAALPAFLSLSRSLPEPLSILEVLDSYMDFVNPKDLNDSALTTDLMVFPARPTDNQGGVVLNKGTVGKVINESIMGSLVQWKIEYNGWSLIGRVIENAIYERVWDETALSSLLLVIKTLSTLETREQLDRLLQMLNAALATDFVQMLQDQFESLLSAGYEQINLVLLVLKFFTQLAKLHPARVYSMLRYSYLLEINGEGGYMSGIIGAVEVFKNDFSFTSNILRIISLLSPPDAEIEHQTHEKLIRHVFDVFESFYFWSYNDLKQRDQIMGLCLEIFSSPNVDRSYFYSQKRLLQPLIEVLRGKTPELTAKSIKFCESLIRSRQDIGGTLLERELYAASPQLVALFDEGNLKVSVLRLFEALVDAKGDQASLLAYLGSGTSKLFLQRLNTYIKEDLESDSVLVATCRLFSAAAKSKQQGLKVLMMKGDRDEKNSLFETVEQKIISSHRFLSYKALSALLNAVAAQSPDIYSQQLVPVLVKQVREGFEMEFDDTDSTCYFIYSVGKSAAILSHAYFKDPANAAIKELVGSINVQDYLLKFLQINGYDFELYSELQQLISKGSVEVKLSNTTGTAGTFDGINFPDYGTAFIYKDSQHQPQDKLVSVANQNLCFVHAQSVLVQGWADFMSSLIVRDETPLEPELIALNCLRLCTNKELSTPFFAPIVQQRVGLAFFALFRQQKASATPAAAPSSKAVTTSDPRLEIVETTLSLVCNQYVGTCSAMTEKPIGVYKILLRILSLALDGLQRGTPSSNAALEILKSVVVGQIPLIILLAHSDSQAAAEDLQCFIILLRSSLALIEKPVLPNVLVDINFAQSIAKLYSGKLDSDKPQPLFARLTLVYILEWLQAKDMAWYFLSNGTIQTLLDAPMSELIHRGGITASQTPYLHQIWLCLLKIFLTLLDQLGQRAHVATNLFYGRFESQFLTCFSQWKSGRISGELVQETSLTITFFQLMKRPLAERDDLVQAIDHLSSHRKYLATRIVGGSETATEQMVKEMATLRDAIVD